ncbi:MAG: prepilin-type N-terminal cleavage/methylation domain-containing protein [Candidatus Omnitrophica bacterium]|nr:prepilin-type N-terminal cleavage/methylation domain-containing protein [Candidatus Omnitrophota bacterium]
MDRINLRGFTLVELLLAASISSVVMLGVYSVFRSGLFAYNKIDSASAVYQSSRMLLSKLETDLKNSFIYTRNDSFFKGGRNFIEFFTISDRLNQDGEASSFVCRGRYVFDGEVLKYSYPCGSDSLKTNETQGPEELILGVKDISFKYAYKIADKDSQYNWQESWPGEERDVQKSQLAGRPAAVGVVLTLKEQIDQKKDEESTVVFEKTIPLF